MGENSMTVRFPGGKRADAACRGFEISTDQSPENGGEGAAPEPFELFLASLATCAGIYVLGFCQKRGIPHDGIRLVQSWQRDEKTRRLVSLAITIEVPPTFPERYHEALVRVANQCAVKKAIASPPRFEIHTIVG